MPSNLESRIKALECRVNRQGDVPRNEAGIAAYAEDNFKKEIAPGVLERAQANGVDLIEQCIAESPEFRAWDDKLTYRDNSGRVTAHLVCCYDMAEPDAYGTPT